MIPRRSLLNDDEASEITISLNQEILSKISDTPNNWLISWGNEKAHNPVLNKKTEIKMIRVKAVNLRDNDGVPSERCT
mgnify:CR=1 FL=1